MLEAYDDDSSHDGRDPIGPYPPKQKRAVDNRQGRRSIGIPPGANQGNQTDDSYFKQGNQQTQTAPGGRHSMRPTGPSGQTGNGYPIGQHSMSPAHHHLGNGMPGPREEFVYEDKNGVSVESQEPLKTYAHVHTPKKSHIPGLSGADELPNVEEDSSGDYSSSRIYSSSYSYSYNTGSRSTDKRKSSDNGNNNNNINNNNSGNNNNNGCCNPCCSPCCQPCGQFYNPCQQQIYQSPCQIGVIPMRSAAFQAPRIPLPKLCKHLLPDGEDEDEDEDGVAFQFKPQTNCRTEVTFTIEPKPQPPWLTMLNCGFKPMVNCSAPPCYLSPNGNPGMSYMPGTQTIVNRTFGNQVTYAGMANFPTLDQIKNTLPGSKITQESDGATYNSDYGSGSGSYSEGSDYSDEEKSSGSKKDKDKKRGRSKRRKGGDKDQKRRRRPGANRGTHHFPDHSIQHHPSTFQHGMHPHHHPGHPGHHPGRASMSQHHHDHDRESEESGQDSELSRSDDWH